MIHPNSRQAYEEEKPKLSKRAQVIYDALIDIENPMTDRQVQVALGFAERGMVQPRITELINAGLVCECGKTKCKVTNKQVRLVSGNIEHYITHKDWELLNEGR